MLNPDASAAHARLRSHPRRYSALQTGATLVEFVVVVPTLLFMLMNLIQYGLLYHAKSQLNYATYEAARAGTVSNANPTAIRTAFLRAMTGYYGGGTTTAQLAVSYGKAVADSPSVRIEILSPTKESFDDYASPGLAARLNTSSRVIPNSNLAFIKCPMDVPGCNNNPTSNQSGQTLADANLLKIRITYGIPERKQIPLAGPFMYKILKYIHENISPDPDASRVSLLNTNRIPVVTHTVMRMQSPAYESANASIPGPGNGGEPKDPGPGPVRAQEIMSLPTAREPIRIAPKSRLAIRLLIHWVAVRWDARQVIRPAIQRARPRAAKHPNCRFQESQAHRVTCLDYSPQTGGRSNVQPSHDSKSQLAENTCLPGEVCGYQAGCSIVHRVVHDGGGSGYTTDITGTGRCLHDTA